MISFCNLIGIIRYNVHNFWIGIHLVYHLITKFAIPTRKRLIRGIITRVCSSIPRAHKFPRGVPINGEDGVELNGSKDPVNGVPARVNAKATDPCANLYLPSRWKGPPL